jgi:hypothetical protein
VAREKLDNGSLMPDEISACPHRGGIEDPEKPLCGPPGAPKTVIVTFGGGARDEETFTSGGSIPLAKKHVHY